MIQVRQRTLTCRDGQGVTASYAHYATHWTMAGVHSASVIGRQLP